jgi:molybdate transport system substrate-binding protein
MTMFNPSSILPNAAPYIPRLLGSLTLSLVCLAPAFAGPGELTVLSLIPLKEAVSDALAKFEKDTGRPVSVHFVNRSQLKAGLHGSEHPDVVMASEEVIAELEKAGQTQKETRSGLGRTGLGVATPQAAAAIDLTSPEAFKQAILQSKSLIYADPSENAGGQQVKTLIEKLELSAAVKAKTQLGTGNNPVAPVGFGDVAMGVYSINEILLAKGAKLAGPLPAPLQVWIRYDAAMVAGAPNQSEAKQLMAYLLGAQAKQSFASKGFEAIP